jgi:hypothetical protein
MGFEALAVALDWTGSLALVSSSATDELKLLAEARSP